MPTPDEVRAAFERVMREKHGWNDSDLLINPVTREYEESAAIWAFAAWKSAYASGSAARRERDVGILRDVIENYRTWGADTAAQTALQKVLESQ